MNFCFDEKQNEIKETAKIFAIKKLNERLAEKEKSCEFSQAGWKACAEFGLQGMILPERYGGLAFDLFDVVATLEGIGYGCRDNGLIFSINAHIWGSEIALSRFGSDALKEKYLASLCNGSMVGANAMTEPNSGSNVYALTTTAVKKDNFYILNGTKTFVTNGPIADLFLVYAKTGKSPGFSNISCFLVEKGTKGLSVGKKFEKMGLRTSPMSEVSFQDCEVHAENLVGKEGMGGIIFNDSMEWERTFILVNSIGIMEYLIDKCIEYARIRKTGSLPIGKFQSVSNRIADMKARLEASRSLIYKAVSLKRDSKQSALDSSIAKLNASEAYIKNCQDALLTYGGYGYMTESMIECELRDALASSLYSGTSDIQRNIITALLGL
ncbi:MAG: acyl-CoA dehydrogenase family protein [Candidatus Omnitrophota bacterium]